MSDYGADENPDIVKAQDIVFTKKLMPQGKPNVMQWTYAGGKSVQKYASRIDKSNLLVKFQE